MLGRSLLLNNSEGDPVGFVFYAQRQNTDTLQYPLWSYVDNADNVYLAVGYGTAYLAYQIIKFDSTGTVQWTSNIDNYDGTPVKVSYLNSQSILIINPFIAGVGNNNDLYVMTMADDIQAYFTKISLSDGSLISSKKYTNPDRPQTHTLPLQNMSLVNSAGDLHFGIRDIYFNYNHIIKVANNGIPHWVQALDTNVVPACIVLDNSNNIYAGVTDLVVTYGDRCGVTKLNSSGDRQWDKQYSWYNGGNLNNLDEIAQYIAHDSVNNALYLITRRLYNSTYNNYLLKIDPANGDLLWTKELTSLTAYTDVIGLAVDSEGYVHVGISDNLLIDMLKIDHLGVVQDTLRMTFSGTSIDASYTKFHMSSNDQLYFSSKESGNNSVWVVSIPASYRVYGKYHLSIYSDYVQFGLTSSTISDSTHYVYDTSYSTLTADGLITTTDVTAYSIAERPFTYYYTDI